MPQAQIERTYQQYTLGQLFEKGPDGNPLRFNSRSRHDSNLQYRIPLHQRHPQWKHRKKCKLVESVMKNYSISGMILSKEIKDGDEFFNIEDAQTRLSTLEDFYNDRFPWDKEGNEDYGDSVRFSDLDRHLQRRFENYTINFEVIKNATLEDTHEIFERLQEGEPLRNKD